ncbi:MAG: hypothetical protein ABI647_09900 [Gemmatimonadota bacterium]
MAQYTRTLIPRCIVSSSKGITIAPSILWVGGATLFPALDRRIAGRERGDVLCLVAMGILTTMVTPPALQRGFARGRREAGDQA